MLVMQYLRTARFLSARWKSTILIIMVIACTILVKLGEDDFATSYMQHDLKTVYVFIYHCYSIINVTHFNF